MLAEQDEKKEAVSAPVAITSGLKKKSVPAGLWTKCPSCGQLLFNGALRDNLSVCSKCSYHFIVGAKSRVSQLLDSKSFKEMDEGLRSLNPLNFEGVKSYSEKLKQDQRKTGLNDACLTGIGALNGRKLAFGATDSRFIMGSMGSVVGERITRLIERAAEEDLPLVIISGSGGGARMYEGALSLMQMAKTSMALSRFKKTDRPYISVLTNPTMGGVMASFASLGDVIVAEPGALIGFAGPRVIEQTIRQKLPKDFQTSEFLLEHGLIDMVVPRHDLRTRLSLIIGFFDTREN